MESINNELLNIDKVKNTLTQLSDAFNVIIQREMANHLDNLQELLDTSLQNIYKILANTKPKHVNKELNIQEFKDHLLGIYNKEIVNETISPEVAHYISDLLDEYVK